MDAKGLWYGDSSPVSTHNSRSEASSTVTEGRRCSNAEASQSIEKGNGLNDISLIIANSGARISVRRWKLRSYLERVTPTSSVKSESMKWMPHPYYKEQFRIRRWAEVESKGVRGHNLQTWQQTCTNPSCWKGKLNASGDFSPTRKVLHQCGLSYRFYL